MRTRCRCRRSWKRHMKEVVINKECCTCTRELWRVLFGGVTTLASLLVSLGGWYHCDFHKDKKKICGFTVSPFRAFVSIVTGSLLPQVFMSFVLSSALAATVLQQRVPGNGKRKDELGKKEEDKGKREDKSKRGLASKICTAVRVLWRRVAENGKREDKGKRGLANKICTMVVWIRIDEATYNSLFRNRPSLKGLFGEKHEKLGPDKAPGIEDALFFKEGKSLRASLTPPTPTDPPAVLQQSSTSAPEHYYLCSQSWEANNLVWKEALLQTEEVLPEGDELQMIQIRTTWECVVVAVQALGYLVSFLSRFAYGRGAPVSAVEVLSAWISIALVVQVLIIPTLATYCNRGICVDLSENKLRDVVDYYEQKLERKEMLNWRTLLVLVVCLEFLCALFLILIPPLIYHWDFACTCSP